MGKYGLALSAWMDKETDGWMASTKLFSLSVNKK